MCGMGTPPRKASPPRHLSLFSGIGGLDLGFHRAGMTTVGQVENDPRCVSVLERWWPNVPRWDDVRTYPAEPGAADVVSGGFPCQDLSVAGRRRGLAGERSGLLWEFHRILAGSRPAWCVVENVPGLLSANRGEDFAALLGGLAELGYSVAWRVLDAQWFGVAQRRRRVFVVGHLGDHRGPVRVLDLGQGCAGDPPPRREAGQEVAGTLGSLSKGGFRSTDLDGQGAWVPTVAFAHNQRDEVRAIGDLAVALPAEHSGTTRMETLLASTGVRRLTPTECARLQGFPDHWNDHLADSHRYRQFGNAVCVPVAEWIGARLVAAARRSWATLPPPTGHQPCPG